MWFDILKNQELTTSQLGGTLDWENPAIPEEEDDKCRKIIKGMMDRAGKYEYSGNNPYTYVYVKTWLEGTISEESACRALEEFKKIDKTDDNTSIDIPMDKGYILLDKNGLYEDVGIDDYRGNIHFTGFAIAEGQAYHRISVILKRKRTSRYGGQVDIGSDSYSLKLLAKEYQAICEEIFGEYYNTVFKFE